MSLGFTSILLLGEEEERSVFTEEFFQQAIPFYLIETNGRQVFGIILLLSLTLREG